MLTISKDPAAPYRELVAPIAVTRLERFTSTAVPFLTSLQTPCRRELLTTLFCLLVESNLSVYVLEYAFYCQSLSFLLHIIVRVLHFFSSLQNCVEWYL